ncbi:hypothetical protein BEK68_03150 [Ralstonia pickettii]|nr:hypothetical protein BEK68_03150 [Ralstonia pickettii]
MSIQKRVLASKTLRMRPVVGIKAGNPLVPTLFEASSKSAGKAHILVKRHDLHRQGGLIALQYVEMVLSDRTI